MRHLNPGEVGQTDIDRVSLTESNVKGALRHSPYAEIVWEGMYSAVGYCSYEWLPVENIRATQRRLQMGQPAVAIRYRCTGFLSEQRQEPEGPFCQWCGRPLRTSPSDDFCSPECQSHWHHNLVNARETGPHGPRPDPSTVYTGGAQ